MVLCVNKLKTCDVYSPFADMFEKMQRLKQIAVIRENSINHAKVLSFCNNVQFNRVANDEHKGGCVKELT